MPRPSREHLYHEEVKRMLGHHEWLLHRILERITHMTEAQDRFARELGEMKDAVNAAAAKIGELADIIRNNPNNDAILNDAADQMDAMEAQLAAAGTPPNP